jgi:hypothetical protein
MSISPTAAGFRVALRRPSLALAEIAWRWTVGATATAVFFFGLVEYLDSLPVTNGELFFLRTRHPFFVAQAMEHILRGSQDRVVMAALIGALLLGLLWIVAASFGRIATVRALLDYFRSGASSNVAEHSPLRALLRLNFLRAAVVLAALVGFFGAAIVAGLATPDADPMGLAFFLFLPLAALVGLAWWILDWFLSLAGLFAVRDGADALGAISAAVGFCRERLGAISAVSTWTGLAHLVAFVGAGMAVSMPMGFAGLVPWRLIVLGMILLTLVYFAVADWLYMARLAGYVCIAEMPEPPPVMLPPLPPFVPPVPALPATQMTSTLEGMQAAPTAPLETTPPQTAPLETTIDRDELILSDVPNRIEQK